MTVPRTELTSLPIACSLDGKGQRARLEDWAELANTATSREELPDGFRYTFAGDDDLEARIRELAAAEQDCCSFLRFEVTRIADQIEMTVKAPADGVEALRFIFAA
jgi:MerR family transcriptional regulator, copper efflux regulator